MKLLVLNVHPRIGFKITGYEGESGETSFQNKQAIDITYERYSKKFKSSPSQMPSIPIPFSESTIIKSFGVSFFLCPNMFLYTNGITHNIHIY